MGASAFTQSDIAFLETLLGSDGVDGFFSDHDTELKYEDAEHLADILSSKLCEVGFDENDEPNDIGLHIEGLIDKCTRAMYD